MRKDILDSAMKCVCHDRQDQYGDLEDNFSTIAVFWADYLGCAIRPLDVANMMILLKIARSKANPYHMDNYIDCAGYSACAGEIAANMTTVTEVAWDERN